MDRRYLHWDFWDIVCRIFRGLWPYSLNKTGLGSSDVGRGGFPTSSTANSERKRLRLLSTGCHLIQAIHSHPLYIWIFSIQLRRDVHFHVSPRYGNPKDRGSLELRQQRKKVLSDY